MYNTWDNYFMDMLSSVASRSSCCRRKIGAIITTAEHEVITTGYNGTPSGVLNCNDGGCTRCNSNIPSGQEYQYCLCVHAEKNAIYSAAKQGKAVTGATVYVSDRPCLQCVVAMIQCKIGLVYYNTEFVKVISPSEQADYSNMIARSSTMFYEYDKEHSDFVISEFYHKGDY